MEFHKKFQPELERCALLNGMNSEERTAFLERCRAESFSAGEEILTEGKSYQGVWILLRGTCEVVKRGANHNSQLAVLEPGAIFGEMSFLQNVTHSASVRALDDVETLRLMREQYDELSTTFPSAAHKIAANIVRVLSDRLRKMDEWTCKLVEKDSDGKRNKEWQEFRAKLYSDLFE